MNQNVILSKDQLEQMSAEDLLSLGSANVQLVTERPVLPHGIYNFELVQQGLEEIGKEKKTAIAVDVVCLGPVQIFNEADAKDLAGVDFAAAPIEYKFVYGLEGGNGFGLRSYLTLTQQKAMELGIDAARDRLDSPNFPGSRFQGELTVNTYLPEGKPDVPANYITNNKLNVTSVIWQ